MEFHIVAQNAPVRMSSRDEELWAKLWVDVGHASTGPNQTRLEKELATRGLPKYTLKQNEMPCVSVEPNGTRTLIYHLFVGENKPDKYISITAHEPTATPNYDANPIIEQLAERALGWLWKTHPCPELALYRLESRMTQLEQKVDRLLDAQNLRD